MSFQTSSSHCNLPPKLPFIDSNLDQSMLDSSLEVNISHAGFGDSASALMTSHAAPPNIKSFNGYGSARASTNLLHAALAAPKPQCVPRSSSISRAYSATLSKLSGNSSRLSVASIKFSEKSAVTISKALSSRNPGLRKRPGLPDFNPPHCERKVFDDGIVVQMIGSAIPPRLVPTIRLEGDQIDSFPSIERHIPHIDVEFNLDESSFGLNNRQSAETLHIQVRSPSLELECPDIIAAFEGSLQTIYHSMDDLTLAGDRPAGSSTTTFLSPFESACQVDVFRHTSPRLSVSLMPKLSPIILSELSSLGDAEPSTPAQATSSQIQTPVTPALSPALTSASEGPSPILTLSVLDDMDEASVTGVDVYFNHDSENDVLTVLNLDLGDTPTDAMSASESDLYGKGRRWDSLNPGSASASIADVQSSGHAGQKPSFSSSSVLAPLTEADFEASFEEVFRTGFTGRHVTQNDDQTTPKPKRLSIATKFSKSMTMDRNMNISTFPRRGHGTSSSRTSLTASLA